MEGGAEGGDLHCQYGQSNVEKYRGLKVQSTKRPRVLSVKGRIQLFLKILFIYEKYLNVSDVAGDDLCL